MVMVLIAETIGFSEGIIPVFFGFERGVDLNYHLVSIGICKFSRYSTWMYLV